MDINLRRVTLPGALVLALLILSGWTAAPARAAEPDWSQVAESIGEAGYYVDSSARHFKSDKALDQLRGAQDKSTPVFIAVLPAAVRPAMAITRIRTAMKRTGTYVVLTGDKLQVSSTALPKATVNRAYSKAVTANKGKPALALVSFVRAIGEKKVGNQVAGRPKTPKPTPGVKKAPAAQQGAPLPGSAPAPQAKEQKKDSGGSSALPLALGGVAVLAALGGGFFLWRRRSGSPAGPSSGL